MKFRRSLYLLTIAILVFCCSLADAQTDIKSRIVVQAPRDGKLARTRIDSVFIASQSVLWGTAGGVFVENADGFGTWWTSKNAPFKQEEFVAVAARNGEIWIGVRNPAAGQGIFLFDGSTWTRFHPSLNEMLSDLVNCILVDGKERVWIGYEERGIDRYIGEGYGKTTLRLFGGIKVKAGLLPGSVNALTDAGGMIWAGTNSGLCRFNPESEHKAKFESWTFGKNFPDQAVWALIPYGDGRVAAGTDQGFVLPDGAGWKLIGMKDGLSSMPIKALCSEKGRVWVGHTNGLQVYEDGKLSALLYTPDLLPAQSVRCLAARVLPDGSSRIYVGTEAGARVFSIP